MKTPADPAPARTGIVTLTMNPALDITTSVGVVRPTQQYRFVLPGPQLTDWVIA